MKFKIAREFVYMHHRSLTERKANASFTSICQHRVIIIISKLDGASLWLSNGDSGGERDWEVQKSSVFSGLTSSKSYQESICLWVEHCLVAVSPLMAESCGGHQSKREFTAKVGKEHQKANVVLVTAKRVPLALCATLLLFVTEKFLWEWCKNKEMFSFEQ